MYKVHKACSVGGSGGIPPGKILNIRPSEMVSDAQLG